MLANILLLLLLLLTGCGGSARERDDRSDPDTAAARPLSVAYIANEGFLISVGSDKVLIDALVRNPWGYDDTPDDLFQSMLAGDPPFDGVDLQIASHGHADHFNPSMMYAYLTQHPEVTFVSSARAVAVLRDSAGTGYEGIGPQVREVNPEWGGSTEVTVDGIRARFLTLNHAAPEEPFLTLGSLVEIAGRKVLHLADMNPAATWQTLRDYELGNEEIDVLFADHFFVLSDVGTMLIRDHIKPKHLVMMHNRPDERAQIREQLSTVFPDAVLFDGVLETRLFE